MSFKRGIFWAHLVVGVVTGIVVLFLSVTGLLLTYERQIVNSLEKIEVNNTATRLDADELMVIAKEITKGKATGMVFSRDVEDPIAVKIGRRSTQLVDPVTGESLEGAVATREFFHFVTVLHRWFALDGTSRETARAITGAANLGFLFIVISGLYLWFPKRWSWRSIKVNFLFKRSYPTSKARDYNWHHVIGIWCLIPLFFVISTAVVFSYDWANKAVFSVYGEDVPKRGGPRGESSTEPAYVGGLTLEALLEQAKTYDSHWKRITLQIPRDSSPTVNFTVDTGTGGQPQKQTTLTLARAKGELVKVSGFSDRSAGMQTRVVIRFLHTGEVLGFVGQTIAGLVSLGACFLVYTGLCLAYRRLLSPMLLRRKAAK